MKKHYPLSRIVPTVFGRKFRCSLPHRTARH